MSKTTLDAIGLAALGLQFNNLSDPTEFAKAFEEVFGLETSPLRTIMAILNAYIPIRRLLPIKVNRDYLNANGEIRRLLRQQIRKRKRDLANKEKVSETDTDLLTVMVKQKAEGVDPWSEDEMLNHVRHLSSFSI